jgi:hypothetical protein
MCGFGNTEIHTTGEVLKLRTGFTSQDGHWQSYNVDD